MKPKTIDQDKLKAEGRYGRDNHNLSWSLQRKACLARDLDRCVICGARPKKGEKPLECHHVIPFRVSHSHALNNLITVCVPCHRKLDAQINLSSTEEVPYVRVRGIKTCKNCGKSGRKLFNGFCLKCLPEVYKKRVLDMYHNEWTVSEISQILHLNKSMVYKILHTFDV